MNEKKTQRLHLSGSSREAILVLLAVLVAGVLLQRRALGRRLEVLEADLALDALGGEVLSA